MDIRLIPPVVTSKENYQAHQDRTNEYGVAKNEFKVIGSSAKLETSAQGAADAFPGRGISSGQTLAAAMFLAE